MAPVSRKLARLIRRVAQAEEPFDGVAAHFPAVVDLAPGVLGGPILVALGLAIDALVERLPAQLRRQHRLKLDLTLGLVVRLRGAAAAADTEQLRLVADVTEGARRVVVARPHVGVEPHVAAGVGAAAADGPAFRESPVGAARARAHVGVAAVRGARRLEVGMLAGGLRPPPEVVAVLHLARRQLVANELGDRLRIQDRGLQHARVQLAADLLERVLQAAVVERGQLADDQPAVTASVELGPVDRVGDRDRARGRRSGSAAR